MTLILLAMPPFAESSGQVDLLQRRDETLEIPVMEQGMPGAGKRVLVRAPEYEETDVHHTIYLPRDWTSTWQDDGQRWPVIIEYTGNRFPRSGSTGEVKDAGLGYGLTGGQFIWATLPFVDAENSENALNWWGSIDATIAYAKREVPRLCNQYGGDPNRVFLCGFSRGAIAASFIGLHDDEIAGLWCGIISHDHFDGVREWRGTTWGSPLDQYREEAANRLRRFEGRPILVCNNHSTREIREFLATTLVEDDVTYLDVDTESILGSFPNEWAIHPHNDRWLVLPSESRDEVWNWMKQVSQESIRD